MTGIIFFKTRILRELQEFYISKLEMEVWLEQEDCTVLRHGNLLVGFCQRDNYEINGMITLFYDSKSDVDAMYERLVNIAEAPPIENKKYKIYQFFAKDPEGRVLEFQHFMHSVPPV